MLEEGRTVTVSASLAEIRGIPAYQTADDRRTSWMIFDGGGYWCDRERSRQALEAARSDLCPGAASMIGAVRVDVMKAVYVDANAFDEPGAH